jgi:2-phosphoglycerate kinase
LTGDFFPPLDALPYSKGLFARALSATGLSQARAYELAVRVEAELASRGEQEIELERFEQLARELLGDEAGERAARNLRRYRDFRALDRPLIVLIGGATGTGKSTVATEVAYRLGITRVTSTDFVRHTMRAFFSRAFMPSIHHSSFEVGRATAAPGEDGDVIAGFLDQTRNVLVGVGAALERAMQERWSMVLEGIHLVPGMVPPVAGAIVVHTVLAIDDEAVHAGHFWVRDAVSEGVRPMHRYLDALDDIRLIQSHLVKRSERFEVPVLENSSMEETVASVMELVLSSVERLERV